MLWQELFSKKFHQNFKEILLKKKKLVLSGVSNYTAKAFLISNVLDGIKKMIVWVSEDEEEIYEMKKAIRFWGFGKVNYISKNDTESDIIEKLLTYYNKTDENIVLFFTKDSLKRKLPTYSALKNLALNIKKHDEFSSMEIMNNLIRIGYHYSNETVIKTGRYKGVGDTLEVHSLGYNTIYKIETEFDKVSAIFEFDPIEKKIIKEVNECNLYPSIFPREQEVIIDILNEKDVIILDEIDDNIFLDYFFEYEYPFSYIQFTAFPREQEDYSHLRYLSVLKFYSLADLLDDLRNKIYHKWETVIYTKRKQELIDVFHSEKISFSDLINNKSLIKVIEAESKEYMPLSFQNPEEKISFITDKEIFSLKKYRRNQSLAKMDIDFVTSLNRGDFVVHFDHGIGIFRGIIQKTIEGNTREYLELEFLENDKLFVPVEQADKVSKYLTENGQEVKLNRLGGSEWKKQVKQAKKKTESIAKELLELYAKRSQIRREKFSSISKREEDFIKTFPYEETPGQIKAIFDVQMDFESNKPMDRLICGDVGFGKTEVAMRAAFRAVENGKQVVFISPITILAEQHYMSFKKRMDNFNIKIEMLSRFRSNLEQSKIIKDLQNGKLDIVIGTHRLLQPDVKFFNLGLIIIDEEQRFGVKQKEMLKNLRTQVDVLTLTATPIPRTLNLSLNKLRDITTITTPPPGRLPIITEVRRYSVNLIRDAILKEIERKGQVYFLHNQVETIESIAQRLRELIPEASFLVAHGQMNSMELEKRILNFKKGEFDVLVSSTIIENGIDLPNANTMIINNAERFGLAQLYQLRGRIGRSKRQAYAYLLYHTQKLNMDAKKRLRSIIEASELGAGFQISMRDLEIRGAGEIIGSSQHGNMKTIGVSHFLKLLQKTIRDIEAGRVVSNNEIQTSDICIELPVNAYIPNEYIPHAQEKIGVYQKLAAVETIELLDEFYEDISDEYGKMPVEVINLFNVLKLKIYSRKAFIEKFILRSIGSNKKEIHIMLGKKCTPNHILKALEKNKTWIISGSTLRIDKRNLKSEWFDEVLETVKAMAEVTENS